MMSYRALFALLALHLMGCDGCRCAGEPDRAPSATPAPAAPARDAIPIPVEVDRPDAGGRLPVVWEREPNNWPEFAQTIIPATAVRGHVGPPITKKMGDRDVYCFNVPGPGRRVLRVELRGVPRLVLGLEVRTRRWGTVYTGRSVRPGKGLVVPNLSLEAGDYCFMVREARGGPPYRFNRKKPYELSFSLRAEAAAEEREPNNKFYSANPLPVDRELRGLLGRRRDEDWYRVSLTGLPAGTLLSVTYRGVAGVTAEVTVYDYARREIASRRGTRGEAVRLRDLRVQLHTGLVYVRVASGRRFDPDRRYRLKVSATTARDNREVEPNDSPRRAVKLSRSRGEVRGTIEVAKDQDWYLLPLASRSNLRLQVKPPAGLDVAVRVTDLRGRRLAHADEGRTGEPELLANVRASAGVRIRVRGARRTFDPKGSYRLLWVATPADRGDEREPNDKQRLANRLAPGVSAQGYIHPDGDEDWYRFRLTGPLGSTRRIRLSVQGIPGVRLQLTLLDGQNNVLTTSRRPTSEGSRIISTTVHCAKHYYVRVRDEQGRRSNPIDNYELLLAVLRR